jgi:two-component system invasion response regulator UvrY
VVNALLFNVIMPGNDNPESLLSGRELEILKLIAAGLHLSEIADKLFFSAKTISTHKANLMHKLGIKNNADLIRYAARQNLKAEVSKSAVIS